MEQSEISLYSISKALGDLVLIDDPSIAIKRTKLKSTNLPEHEKADLELDLARQLCAAGCSYEAKRLLHGKKKLWAAQAWADLATACLGAQTWWSKEGRDFAMLRQESRAEEALGLIGEHAFFLWDFPPVLQHLVAIARQTEDIPLQAHVAGRLDYLCTRGVEGMNMKAFTYLAKADLLEAQALSGDPVVALSAFEALSPNTGNRMHYDLRLGEIQVMAGQWQAAMRTAAQVLIDAEQRSDYGRDLRVAWIDDSPRIAALREQEDWHLMIEDPKHYLKALRSELAT